MSCFKNNVNKFDIKSEIEIKDEPFEMPDHLRKRQKKDNKSSNAFGQTETNISAEPLDNQNAAGDENFRNFVTHAKQPEKELSYESKIKDSQKENASENIEIVSEAVVGENFTKESDQSVTVKTLSQTDEQNQGSQVNAFFLRDDLIATVHHTELQTRDSDKHLFTKRCNKTENSNNNKKSRQGSDLENDKDSNYLNESDGYENLNNDPKTYLNKLENSLKECVNELEYNNLQFEKVDSGLSNHIKEMRKLQKILETELCQLLELKNHIQDLKISNEKNIENSREVINGCPNILKLITSSIDKDYLRKRNKENYKSCDSSSQTEANNTELFDNQNAADKENFQNFRANVEQPEKEHLYERKEKDCQIKENNESSSEYIEEISEVVLEENFDNEYHKNIMTEILSQTDEQNQGSQVNTVDISDKSPEGDNKETSKTEGVDCAEEEYKLIFSKITEEELVKFVEMLRANEKETKVKFCQSSFQCPFCWDGKKIKSKMRRHLKRCHSLTVAATNVLLAILTQALRPRKRYILCRKCKRGTYSLKIHMKVAHKIEIEFSEVAKYGKPVFQLTAHAPVFLIIPQPLVFRVSPRVSALETEYICRLHTDVIKKVEGFLRANCYDSSRPSIKFLLTSIGNVLYYLQTRKINYCDILKGRKYCIESLKALADYKFQNPNKYYPRKFIKFMDSFINFTEYIFDEHSTEEVLKNSKFMIRKLFELKVKRKDRVVGSDGLGPIKSYSALKGIYKLCTEEPTREENWTLVRDAVILGIRASTGHRYEDIENMTLDNFKNKTYILESQSWSVSYCGHETGNTATTEVEISEEIIHVMQIYIEKYRELKPIQSDFKNYIFLTRTGEKIKNLQVQFNRFHNLDIKFNDNPFKSPVISKKVVINLNNNHPKVIKKLATLKLCHSQKPEVTYRLKNNETRDVSKASAMPNTSRKSLKDSQHFSSLTIKREQKDRRINKDNDSPTPVRMAGKTNTTERYKTENSDRKRKIRPRE